MKKRMRMGDFSWRVTEELIAKYFPELPELERAEAAENHSAYLSVVARIYDQLNDEGRLKDVLLRAQYDKRNRKNYESQNVNDESDDTSNTLGESNASAS